MEKLIEQPPISEEILNKTAEFLTNRYELKDLFVVQQFTEDANRVMEQFQLYSSTIHQLQTFMNGPNSHLLRKFHFNLFKVMHFLVKLVGKIGERLQKKALPQQTPKAHQLCGNCLENVQCRNIKTLQRQLNQYIIPNYDKNYGSKELDDEHYLYDEEAITSEQQLARKMTKLQRNLSDRQTSLMRCLEQFENFRSDLMVGLKKKDQDTGIFDKFDFKDYAFKLSVHFADQLKKIEEKIRRLKQMVKKQEDKAVQASPKEGSNEIQNLQKQQADSIKVINLRAQTEIRKCNQAKNKIEELAKRYYTEAKQLTAKLDLLEEKNQNLKEQLFVQKLKNSSKSKNNNNKQNTNEADADLQSRRDQSQKGKDGLSIDLQGVYEEQESLINEFSNRVMHRLSEMQSVNSKLEDVFPLLKATFKRTLDNFMNQRMSSTLDRRKIFKFESNEEENSVKPRRRSHKKSMKFHMDQEFFKEISRFSPQRLQANLKIQSQYSFKISNFGKKLSIRQDRFNQIQRSQSRFTKKATASNNIYKKSVLQTEGDVRKKTRNLKLNSIFTEPKDGINQAQDTSNIKKTSQYLTQNYSQLQMQTSMFQTADFKQLKRSKMRRNKSQDQYLLTSFSGSQDKDKDNLKHINDIMQISKINCRVVEQNIINNFLLVEQEKNNIEITRQATRIRTTYKENTTVHQAAKSEHHLKLPKNNNKGTHHQTVVFRMQELNFLTTFFTFMAKAHLTNPSLYTQLKQSFFQKQKGFQSETDSKTQMMKEALGPVILRHRKCISQGLCAHLIQFIEAVRNLLSPGESEIA